MIIEFCLSIFLARPTIDLTTTHRQLIMQQPLPLLSIVIPVYNVEKYIGKCLESCLNQDLDDNNYEIIVVNDGSTDNSPVIINTYIQQYNNIKVIHQENGGQSVARNTGLAAARGKYIWFIDSDDTITPNSLGNLIETACAYNLDVLCFTLNFIYQDGQSHKFNIVHENNRKIYRGEDFICKVIMPDSACIALFKKDYLTNISLTFLEGIIHEDKEFTVRAYSLANRISYIDTPCYGYYQREGSTMKSDQDKKRCEDLLKIADSLYDFVCKNFEAKQPAFNILMQKIYFTITQSLAFYNSAYFSLREYRKRPYFPMKYKSCPKSMRYKLLLANISLTLYIFLHRHKKCILL